MNFFGYHTISVFSKPQLHNLKMDYNKISIKKFNMKTIKEGDSILILGKKSTGKSSLVLDIIDNTKIQKGIIFSEIEELSSFYKKINEKNKVNIHTKYDINVISNLITDIF